MKRLPLFLPLVASAALLVPQLHADVKLPAIISDHMVLQQDTPANVWGWADPGERVTVKFADKSAETVTAPDGKWSAKLSGLKAGMTGELQIAGKNSLTVKDVLVGEVWVCSGQSNMEWIVRNALNPQEEAAAANFPQIRMFTVQKASKLEPQKDCLGRWDVCSPQTVSSFSAVGYFFGRKLNQTLQQPIGLIHTSWGGTPAEFWTPEPVLGADPDFKPIFTTWEQKKTNYPKAKADYDAAMEKWREEEKAAKAEGKEVPRPPRAPQGGDAFGAPACLYNAMIEPLVPYTVRGAIWYQGEANAGNGKLYQKLFPTMIQSWRKAWGIEMPFLFVQLANFNARGVAPTGNPEDSQWAELREAQAMTLELPRTGMAVAIDIGEATDIHPKNKQEVGRRLALIAEATVYFKDQEYSGPLFSGAQMEDGKVRLSFRHSEGLKASDGGKLKGFAIAGADKKWVWGDATIEGDHVVISNSQVTEPVAVRYNWADNPSGNLVNGTGLPASPFRSDEWGQNPRANK